ncbi:oxalate/formate antiporter (macronuclear) [Tetrahymena thermophila SB210]|uniref:Oxalate/formate antiporter n=1 Tax=Tetrahymena thermophila (strain SB210) TaxID=312017 RepID=I7MF74_TETTS|nr:oxalate/formate antiporter [Tetrahymena thermophila SB210]EAR99450.2 oxalate/formate antiporter [Tetrahymena thermophila SB210]|eukprot:XP_001019695.2 oxalate/formate antiporter [Tetrahymena thermophila SB210]
MKLTNTQRGLLTVFGGFTVHLVIGAVFMWGTLNVYITSYFRQLNDEGLALSVGGAIFPVMMLSVATGMPLGIKAVQLFGSARYYVMAASIICSFLVFISSYCTYFWQYVLVFGILFGLFSGTIYFIPIYMGYLYFPKKKGFVSGTVLCGYGLCSLVMGLTFFSFVNPDNLTQEKDHDGYSYFQGSSVIVAQRVPEALRKMSLIYVILSVFGSCFIMYHPNQIGEEERRLKKLLQEKKKKEEILKHKLDFLSSEQLKPVQQQDKRMSEILIQKKKEVLQQNIEIIEKQEKVIEKHIELQKIEDQQKIQYIYSAGENNQENAQINYFGNYNPNDNDDERNAQLKQTNTTSSFIQTKVNIDMIFMEEDGGQNRKAHTNEYVEEIEKEIEALEMSVKLDQQSLNKETQKVEQIQKQLEKEEYQKMGAPSVYEALKKPQYYMSLLLAFLAVAFPIIINGNYKSVAKDYGFLNDSYQTLVGALVSAANGLSRPAYASLLDKFTFKQMLTCILCFQIFLSLTCQLTNVNEVFFAIWMFLINTTFGGVLAMWPVFSAQLNGVKVGSTIYGTYWWAFGFSNFLQFIFVYFLKPKIGFNNIFYIYTGIAFSALLLLRLYNFQIDWSTYYKKKQEKEEKVVALEVLQIKTLN